MFTQSLKDVKHNMHVNFFLCVWKSRYCCLTTGLGRNGRKPNILSRKGILQSPGTTWLLQPGLLSPKGEPGENSVWEGQPLSITVSSSNAEKGKCWTRDCSKNMPSSSRPAHSYLHQLCFCLYFNSLKKNLLEKRFEFQSSQKLRHCFTASSEIWVEACIQVLAFQLGTSDWILLCYGQRSVPRLCSDRWITADRVCKNKPSTQQELEITHLTNFMAIKQSQMIPGNC